MPAVRPLPQPHPGPSPPEGGWAGALVFGAGSAAVILTLYLLLPLVAGYRFPIGPDGPVYTWWTKGAAVLGLDAVAPGRPGVPAAALVLGGAFGTSPLQTITVLGPVLAAACGLAASGFLDVALPPSPIRALAAALLTGAFAAYLAGGWLANLTQVTVFLGALAALAASLSSWRAVIAAAGLIAAAALAHRLFAAVALLILAGAAAWGMPSAVARRRQGVPLVDTLAARMAIAMGSGALLAAAGFAAAGLVAVGPPGAVPGDTAQDGFFRRLGLRDLLVDRYRERLAGDLSRAAGPLVAGTALAAAGAPVLRSGTGREDVTRPPPTYLVGILVSWTAITVLGVLALWLTGLGPPNRMVAFAFFLPLGAAVGVDALIRRRMPGGVTAGGILAALAAIAFIAVAMFGWYRHAPSFAPEELAAARRAGAVIDRLSPRRSAVILVDTDQPAAAFHVTRFANVLRMGMPPERLPHVRIAVATPRDYLRGRPTLTGDPEHDLIATTYFHESMAVQGEPVVLVVRAFNPGGFGVIPGAVTVAEGVEVVQGKAVARAPAAVPSPAGLSFAAVAGLSAAALALLAALGLGWSRWALPMAGPRAVLSVAPSVGLAVAIFGGFLADRVGPGAGAPWGIATAGTIAVVGYVAAARAPRRPDAP